MKGEKEELQEEEEYLDDSTLSIRSEIEGQKRCLEILNNNFNVLKDFKQGGGFKDIKILGKQYKPEFIQFVNNKKNNNNNQATNDNVFGYKECFYHALLRTIENEKGIKFIGKNIQRFAGKDLNHVTGDGDVYLCLYLIANLFYQINETVVITTILQPNISLSVRKMSLLNPHNEKTLKEMSDYIAKQFLAGKTEEERCQKYLQATYEKLDEIIDLFEKDDKKIINKFLCQLFFLIFFTNKVDIKPGNILVEKNNNNVNFIHTDVNDFPKCTGMFDTFEKHKLHHWHFNKLFLKIIWKRISSNELSEYFNEYVKKYTLTEDKIKKIISRTVRNVFRSNDDIKTNKIYAIDQVEIISVCHESFRQMKEYMQYMLNTVIKEIELNDGDNEKKKTLINVLEQNCKVLNDMLADNKIDNCVDRSIKKYLTLKQEILINTDEKYNNNDKTQKELEHEIRSTNKDDIINTTNNMRAKYNCWCIGDNDCVGRKKNGSGCGCFGCDIC